MLRFALIAALAVMTHTANAQNANDPSTQSEQRPAEKLLEDRDAMLKETMDSIAKNGYRDLAVAPWFVIIAKNDKGKDVVLLVDPVSKISLELEAPTDENAELELPKWQH